MIVLDLAENRKGKDDQRDNIGSKSKCRGGR